MHYKHNPSQMIYLENFFSKYYNIILCLDLMMIPSLGTSICFYFVGPFFQKRGKNIFRPLQNSKNKGFFHSVKNQEVKNHDRSPTPGQLISNNWSYVH